MSLPRILVTGFGPFPGVRHNPSGTLATKLIRSPRMARFAEIEGAVIPTVYDEILFTFRETIKAAKPDAILMFGVAARTPYLRIETRARNTGGQFHADAAGKKAPRTLVRGAPGILRVRAPVKSLVAAARKTGIRAELSSDAGHYICNAALFTALDVAKEARKHTLAVFVHIPMPRRKRNDPRPTAAQLDRAGEAILIALSRAMRSSNSA